MARGKKLQWFFELLDRMSGPARKISRAVDGIDRSVNRAAKAVDRLERRGRNFRGVAAGADRAAKSVDKLARATERAGRAGRSHGMHGGGMLGGLPGKIMGTYFGGLMAWQMARGIGSAVFGPPVAFARAGLGAAAFREQRVLGLGTMLGSSAKGESLFAEAERMARATGTPVREMVDRYAQLTAMGFGGDRLRQVMAGVGDLAIVGGQDKASRALLAITQIKAKGRLQAEELMQQLAETGVDIDEVYKILGRRTGLDKAGVLKAMQGGKIDSDLGIDAILEFIQGRYSGGKLGSMAAKYSKTGAGLWANLMSAPDRFLFDLEKSEGYRKAKRALENLVAVLDPETEAGQRLKARATEMFDRILGGLFDRFQDPKAVEVWVGKLIDGFERLIPTAERLATALGDIAGSLASIGRGIDVLDRLTAYSWWRAAPKLGDAAKSGVLRLLDWNDQQNEAAFGPGFRERVQGAGTPGVTPPRSPALMPSHGAPAAARKPDKLSATINVNVHGATGADASSVREAARAGAMEALAMFGDQLQLEAGVG